MSLLAPLFLLGALAIAVPIVAHLMRRSTRERVWFSATQFLEPTPPRLDRRNRIEHPWLLLLRCLAVLALAAGFARPFLRESPAARNDAPAARHVVAVLDASASMQRRGLWPAALERTRALVADLGAADRFALITAGRTGSVVIGARQWATTPAAERAALVESAIDALQPGWQPTHLDAAIEVALEELAAMGESGTAPSSVEVVVVSDFTAGARVSGLAGRDWPDLARLRLETIDAADPANASLHWLGWTIPPDGGHHARLRLAHEADTSRDYRVNLRLANGTHDLIEPLTLTLAPHETRAVSIPIPGEIAEPLRAELAGDTELFDNTVWMVLPETRRFPLPYLGPGDASDPRSPFYYLSRATLGWRDPAMTAQPVGETSPELVAAPLVVVAAVPGAAAVDRLRAGLEAGASVVVLARDAALVSAAGTLAGESGWSVGPTNGRADALLADIDFAHPLFASFADPRYSDFTRIRFWERPAIVAPPGSRATVVARFDDGTPAVLECAVGRGTLVVWAGDWTPASSQWVLSTKFVPWFQALARRAAGGPPAPVMAEVGGAEADGLVAPPDALARPGVVALTSGPHPRRIALNVPASESRTAPIPLDAWEALGAPLALSARDAAPAASHVATARAGTLAAARLESEQKLWRWLLLGTAALLAVESVVAMRLAARRPTSARAA